MPQVARDVVKDRARRLREKGEAALASHLAGMVGRSFHVLVETRDMGRTEHFTPVRLAASAEPGAILPVTVTAHDGREAIAA
jgi:threonylcarbamoyladenosine tRNA methylthiotransferase MtaB